MWRLLESNPRAYEGAVYGIRQYTFFVFCFLLLAWCSGSSPCIAAAAAKQLQSCPTLCDPIDGSPPGLPRPWDSPGKNTGVGCHCLLQCVKVKSESEVAQSCPTLSDPRKASQRLTFPSISPVDHISADSSTSWALCITYIVDGR